MFSLTPDLLRRLLDETLPSFQATDRDSDNIGFGFLYYGLARALRPRTVVVIGSKKGFSVICLALGLRDNGGSGVARVACYETDLRSRDLPVLHFVDPSYAIERDPDAMWGIGSWDEPETVAAWWERFGVGDVIRHHKMRSDEFAASGASPSAVDLVLVDGDHRTEGILADVETFSARLAPKGVIVLHDVHDLCTLGGGAAFDALDPLRFNKFRLPVYPGLAFVQQAGPIAEDAAIDPR